MSISLKNPLEDCITILTSFYGIRGDVHATISELSSDRDKVNAGNLIHLGKKLGCKVEEVNWGIDDIKKSHLPIVLFLDNGEARIFFPENINMGQLYKPGIGPVDETLDSISDIYSNKCLLYAPSKTKIQARIDHMIKGFAIDWFWDPIRYNWQSYSEILICALFINLLVLALPLFTMNVYDRVVANFAEYTLIALTIGIILALLFDFTFKVTRSYILETLAANIGSKYDSDLMERLLKIKAYEMEMSVGERVNLFRELQTIRDFFAARLVPMVVDLPFFFLFCFVIYLISPAIVWIPVTGMIVVLMINFAGRMVISRTTKDYFTSMQEKTTTMIEILSGTSTIRTFNAIGNRLFKWRFSAARSAEASRKNHMAVSFISNLSYLVAHLVHVFVVFFGVYQIIESNLTIGGLLACTILSGRAMAPVMSSSGVLAQLKQSLDVLITIDNVFRLPYEKRTSDKSGFKGDLTGKITLKNVTAKYPNQSSYALSEISLSINPGERIGIIGRTGAGKSTLARIITGDLEPESGQLLFNDYAHDAIPPTELRRLMGIVPQDPFFFSGSIRDNVLIGDEMVDEEILNKAIHYSGLDLVMQQIGNGLDTEVGENGCRLSGGQKQAISLARSLVRDPSILIFDEPTTGMDTVLEGRLRAYMTEFLEGRTFIMITHRTSLLSLVDRLVLIDSGKIIADGPRDEVIRKISAKG